MSGDYKQKAGECFTGETCEVINKGGKTQEVKVTQAEQIKQELN